MKESDEGQTNTSERATGCFVLGQRNDHEHTVSEEGREEMDIDGLHYAKHQSRKEKAPKKNTQPRALI